MPLLPFAPAPSSGSSSPLTTKGDIFTHGSSDTRLAVGTDGFILNADSAQTLGIGWSTRDYNLNNKNVFNAAGEVIGGTAFPTSTTGGGASVNTGPAKFASTGTYSISLNTTTNPFTGAWVMNDTITVNATGANGESSGVALRPNMTFSNGQTGQTATLIDGSLNLSGTDTVLQTFTLGTATVVGCSAVTTAYGLQPSLQVNNGSTVTTAKFLRPFLNVQAGGTCTTAIGLDLTTLNGAGTAWAIQAGNYNSYFQGNTMFGSTSAPGFTVDVTGTARITGTLLWGTAIPTATTTGTSLSANPVFASNATYTTTLVASDFFIPLLINDTITTAGAVSNASLYALGVYPSITASSSTTGLSAAGVISSPTFAGTDTYGSTYGLSLNATVKATVTNAYGVNSFVLQNSANTVATLTVFKGQTLKLAGTITTLIGLDLNSLSGGSTTWGIQVGNFNNYFQGKSAFGGTSTPANTVDVQGGSLNYHLVTDTYANPMSIDVTQGNVHKTTTTSGVGNATFNASAATVAGEVLHIIITNDATAARTITFTNNFKPTGTLLGTQSKTAVVSFVSDGTNYYEFARSTGL